MSGQPDNAVVRLAPLDSLRGIAAFFVLAHHCWLFRPFAAWMVDTPLRPILYGRASVIFFFVLSGFVLALGFFGPRPPGFGRYALRRVIRIGGPFLGAAVLALLARMLVAPATDLSADFTNWVPQYRAHDLDARRLARHLLLFGDAEGIGLNPVTWSLVYEIRASLLMPLICLACARRPVLFAGGCFVAFCAVAYALDGTGIGWQATVAETVPGSVLLTLHFTAFFCLGAIAAWYFTARPEEVTQPGRDTVIVLSVVSLGFFSFADVLVAFASAALILLALGHRGLRGVLTWPVFVWLGRVSYSLYVTHYIVLMAAIHGLHGVLADDALIPTGFVAALVVAELAYRWVEAPSTRFGRALTTPEEV